MTSKSNKPIVYSCSGCSNAAQTTNAVAIRLDREHHAEMSCIAGVGGDVRSLVRLAQSDRPIVGLDGCKLHCVRNCLKRHAVEPTLHFTLSDFGVRKRFHEDYQPEDVDRVYNEVVRALEETISSAASGRSEYVSNTGPSGG